MNNDVHTDQTMPSGRWTFDGDVTAVFDDMLQRSIPQYEVMRDAVLSIGSPFIQQQTDVVDIGCSRGEALAPFVEQFGIKTRRDSSLRYVDSFVGIEVSDPMLSAATERFAREIGAGIVKIVKYDLRDGYPYVRASLTLSVFTLQFVPMEYRQRVVQDVYDHTVAGGAFVLVEKILGDTSTIDRLFVDRYYRLKSANGYSQEAIDRKRLSLEGVLVPVTARWNIELLKQAGFKQIDGFWRWMNFAGWLAVKG